MENSHLSALRSKHAEIETRIMSESSRPLPDESLIHALKKKKLSIKDEIQTQLPH